MPVIIANLGEEARKLSEKRRSRWISAIMHVMGGDVGGGDPG